MFDILGDWGGLSKMEFLERKSPNQTSPKLTLKMDRVSSDFSAKRGFKIPDGIKPSTKTNALNLSTLNKIPQEAAISQC